MIYFDNSATGAYKPRSVLRAVKSQLRAPANPGRSGHPRSLKALALLEQTRELAAKLCGVPADQVLFSKNCTESLNLAIQGFAKKGGHAVVTQFDHNSTLRPVHMLSERGEITCSVAFPENGKITAGSVSKVLKKNTDLVVVNCTSNVLGCDAEIEEISLLCRKKGIKLILDGAQWLGHHETDLGELWFTALASAPHKTLFAPQGIAFLAAKELPRPLLFGGTGTSSAELHQPEQAPEGFESGTLNMPGIAGLREGMIFFERNREEIYSRTEGLCRYLYEHIVKLDDYRIYSAPNRAGIVSILNKSHDSTELSDYLAAHGVATRAGLHCAPLVHRYLGTERTGLCRLSVSAFNTEREIERLAGLLKSF